MLQKNFPRLFPQYSIKFEWSLFLLSAQTKLTADDQTNVKRW